MSSGSKSVLEDAPVFTKVEKTNLFSTKKERQLDKEEQEIYNVFPKDIQKITELENVNKVLELFNLPTDFNNVFTADKKIIELGSKKHHLYKNKSSKKDNSTINIVCAAYFKNSGSAHEKDKIIIASRLGIKHIADSENKGGSLTKGGGPKVSPKFSPKDKLIKMIREIEDLVVNNTKSITGEQTLPENILKTEFKDKMTEILKPPTSYITFHKQKSKEEEEFAKKSTVYVEYSINHKLNPDINKKILKFDVYFSIIYVEKKKKNLLFNKANVG